MTEELFHVSDAPGIGVFEPRPSPHAPAPVVWAVDRARLRNYLLPRDCPRVTFFAAPGSAPQDIARYMTDGRPVVAIEQAWLERARRAALFLYRFDAKPFATADATAGYFTSTEPVRPAGVERIGDPLAAIEAEGAELRVLPDLWPLHDAIAGSSLGFSMIRMRNAAPRSA